MSGRAARCEREGRRRRGHREVRSSVWLALPLARVTVGSARAERADTCKRPQPPKHPRVTSILFPRAFSPVHGFEIRRSPRHLHIGSANQWRSHTRARHGARRLPVSKKGKKIPRRFGGWIFYNTSRPIVQLTVQTSPRPRRMGRIKKSNRGKILSYS